MSGALAVEATTAEYEFTWQRNTVIKIEVESPDFDTTLTLQYPDGTVVTDDDSAGQLDSQLGPIELPADGSYAIRINSYNHRYGGYTLTITDYSACGVSPIAIPSSNATRLHTGASTSSAVPRLADSDGCYPIIGQSADGAWLHVHTEVGQMGWVAANEVMVIGDITNVPVADA